MICPLQIWQSVTLAIMSALTITPIATQTSMKTFISDKGCYLFWLTSMTFQWVIAVSGFGMAVYRIIAYHNMFKKNFGARNIERYIINSERILVIGMLLMYIFGIYGMLGWEKSILFQFCMDIGPLQAETIVQHQDRNFPTIVKIIRLCPLVIAQLLILGEISIYVWLIYKLCKHDKMSLKDGIITELTKRERNQKNVITLFGQVTSFFVEFIVTVYIMVHITNNSSLDPSVMPISLIIASTLIAISQIVTSHEMKRFIENDLLNM